eukprot:Opistho-2@9081
MLELLRRSRCRPTALIMALIYLERLSNAIGAPAKAENCAHRLFLTAIILAVKYVSDDVYKNRDFASITGVDVTKINAMEREFLRFLDYRLYVSDQEYASFLSYIEESLFPVQQPMPAAVPVAQAPNIAPAVGSSRIVNGPVEIYAMNNSNPTYGCIWTYSGQPIYHQVSPVIEPSRLPIVPMDFNAYIIY